MIALLSSLVILVEIFTLASLEFSTDLEARVVEQRPTITSLDFCADQYVLSIASHDQIIALSPGAAGEYSRLRVEAQSYSLRRPLTEIILTHRPDAVVRQWGGTQQLLQKLAEHGVKTVQLDYVADIEAITHNIVTIGAALRQEQQARKIVATIHRQQALLKKSAPRFANVRALYVTPGGVTAANGTLLHHLIEEAGVTNLAADGDAVGWPSLPAEALVLSPPDVIIAGFFDSSLEKTSHWSAAKHPVFAKMFEDIPTILLPLDVISCAGPNSLEVSLYLQEQLKVLGLEEGN